MLAILRFLLPCLIALLPAWAFANPPIRVTLLHVNDVYQISPLDKGTRGGLARLATLKKRIQADSPHTFLTLGGDTLSPSVASNAFRGEQMIATWNAAGLDFAVLGNHEFDFGPDILKTRMQESRFTWLAANVRDKSNSALLPHTLSEDLRSIGSIKVGFLGVITTSTAQSSNPGPQLRFDDAIVEARRAAGRLRAKGASIVVALTHLDMAEDRKLAELGIADVILGGHDHELMQTLVGRTPIFKAGSDARFAARIDLFVDTTTRRVTHMDWQILPIDAGLTEDPETAQVVAHFENRLSGLLDKPAGESAVALDARQESNRSGETNLGNWLADIYRLRTQADVALVNGGSIRSNTRFPAGKLSRRDILSILPFENPILKLKVTGKVLREALEHGLSQVAESKESGRFPQVSGLRYSYRPSNPSGARLVSVTINGQPLDDAQTYSLAVNGYMARGGDGYQMLKDQPFLIAPENALSETAEVIETLQTDSPIAPKIDGRITAIK